MQRKTWLEEDAKKEASCCQSLSGVTWASSRAIYTKRFPEVIPPFRASLGLTENIGVARVLCMQEREGERGNKKEEKEGGSARASRPRRREKTEKKRRPLRRSAAVLSSPDRLARRGGRERKEKPGPARRRGGEKREEEKRKKKKSERRGGHALQTTNSSAKTPEIPSKFARKNPPRKKKTRTGPKVNSPQTFPKRKIIRFAYWKTTACKQIKNTNSGHRGMTPAHKMATKTPKSIHHKMFQTKKS